MKRAVPAAPDDVVGTAYMFGNQMSDKRVAYGLYPPFKQAAAFGGVSEGALYISVKVNGISETNPVKEQGWVNAIDSTDYKVPNNGSTKVGKILAISTDATTIRADLDGCYIWKVVLTDGNVYTLNLSSQAEALTSAAE